MSPSPNTDVLLARNGDIKAFERLYLSYWAKVWHFTGIFITDNAEREDIAQQVFLRVWEMRKSLDPEKSFDGLLFIVTRNLVFNIPHKHFNSAALDDLTLDNSLQADDLNDALDAEDMKNYIDSLVAELPRRQQQAFLLSRRDGLSHKEIAEIMGISIKGVERNIHLALKFIKLNLPLIILFISRQDIIS